MADWVVKKLVEVGNIFSGNSINAKNKKEKYTNVSSGIPYIATKDVSYDSIINYDNGISIPKNELNNFRVAHGNSIFICAEGGSAGRKLAFNTKEVCFVNKLFVLEPFEFMEPKFIYYFYQTTDFQKQFMSKMTGLIGGVSMGKFKKIDILAPSLTEQKRIVVILDEAFKSIAKAKESAEKNLKNAKDIFEIYLQSVLKNKKWAMKTLGDVCEKVEYGSSSKSIKEGKIAVLRMGNIQNGRFNWEKLVYSDNLKENKKYLLKYNDVLFNRTNSPELVGKTAIYKDEMPAIFAGYLIRIHRLENLLDADYLNYYLNSEMAMNYGKSVTTSSVNQANINGTKLKNYPIPLPSLSEQQSIVIKLDALSTETKKLEAIYTQKLADLEELKKSILAKAFKGELTEVSI
jgi:type I restriction enzyme S subunit